MAPWAAYRFLKVKGHEHEGITHEGHKGGLERGYSSMMQALVGNRLVRNLFFVGVLLMLLAVMIMPVGISHRKGRVAKRPG